MKSRSRAFKLAIVATHPIQYQAPIYRTLAQDPEIDLRVFYASDHSVKGAMDGEFGKHIAWDIPLLEGYEYEFLENRPGSLPPRAFHEYSCPSLRAKLAGGKFDALLVPGYNVALYLQAIRAARQLGISVFLRGDNSDATGVTRPPLKEWLRARFLRWLYRRIDAGLAVGSYMQRHFARFGMPQEHIFWSPHCVDNAFFRAGAAVAPDRDATRRMLGLSGCDAVAIFCGKLIPVKSPEVLARAIASMNHKKRLGLLVVGDGAMRQQMEQWIAQAAPGASAFVGFKNQSELATYYKAADFLVLPSFSETWGLVVNEAMNFALPAIVSDRVSCAEDLIIPGKTGYLFPRGDSTALAARLDEIVATPGLAQTMGTAAKARIDSFTPQVAAAGIKQALVALSASSGKPT